MFRALSFVCAVGACAAACDPPRAAAGGPDDKERTGTLVGELKSRAEAKNGRSVTIEVLAPGEEKARRYLVAYDPRDPAAEKPYKELRAKVDAAGVGDRVRLTWVNAPKGSEGGFFVTGFEVLRKADRKDGRGENP